MPTTDLEESVLCKLFLSRIVDKGISFRLWLDMRQTGNAKSIIIAVDTNVSFRLFNFIILLGIKKNIFSEQQMLSLLNLETRKFVLQTPQTHYKAQRRKKTTSKHLIRVDQSRDTVLYILCEPPYNSNY